mmetsp:Transcript_149118/g.478959  ORF Transcript_149118/g.478959 Transcript_149118/m.478959 type:complete len:124 (-) Transcript_149118:337-708(-)
MYGLAILVMLLASPLPAVLGSPVADEAKGSERHDDARGARTFGLRLEGRRGDAVGFAAAAAAEVLPAETVELRMANTAVELEMPRAPARTLSGCLGVGSHCWLNVDCCSYRCMSIHSCGPPIR